MFIKTESQKVENNNNPPPQPLAAASGVGCTHTPKEGGTHTYKKKCIQCSSSRNHNHHRSIEMFSILSHPVSGVGTKKILSMADVSTPWNPPGTQIRLFPPDFCSLLLFLKIKKCDWEKEQGWRWHAARVQRSNIFKQDYGWAVFSSRKQAKTYLLHCNVNSNETWITQLHSDLSDNQLQWFPLQDSLV